MQQDGTGRIVTAAPVSHGLCRHGDAALREFSLTIEALRRKLRQPASSAIMISVMCSARGKNSWDCASRSQF